jgi:hypothetical protein
MDTAEDFTGGKITRRTNRATESMFQWVALMIFISIPTLTFAAGNVAPQFEASRTSCPTLSIPKGQLRPSLQLWNVSNGTNQLQS